MIVAELMTPKPVTVAPSDTLEAAHERMEAGRFRQVPVVDKKRLVGILTDRDTRQYRGQLAYTRVDAVMSPHPFSVHPSTPVEKAAHLLMTNKIGSLPVVEDSKLLGIITATDMLRALEAVLGAASEGSSRIDLDLSGSGEIAAATSPRPDDLSSPRCRDVPAKAKSPGTSDSIRAGSFDQRAKRGTRVEGIRLQGPCRPLLRWR